MKTDQKSYIYRYQIDSDEENNSEMNLVNKLTYAQTIE